MSRYMIERMVSMGSLKKIKDFVIYKDDQYNTFPSAAKLHNGDVIVGFRSAPDWQHVFGKVTHVDPSSIAVFVRSKDYGATWDPKPSLIHRDYFLGIQDPCLNVLNDGTLFCTFFTWKVYPKSDVEPKPLDFNIYDRWIGRNGGVYSIRSADGGQSWDEPIPIPNYCNGVRGNIVELDDGSILLPMYGSNDDPSRSVIAVTKDRGHTWEMRSIIASSEDILFQEPNIYKTESGKIVAFLRTRKIRNYSSEELRSPLYTCESYDNGKTWVNLTEHPVYSPSPFQAIRLKSGNVLLTYGCRIRPYGIHAMILDSECSNIGDAVPTVIRDDGPGTDLGYTSAVQMDNGDILIAYYYYDEERGVRYIAGTICREV